MYRKRLNTSVAALAVLAGAVAPHAAAQGAPSGATSSALEEVVVTARRTDERLQTVPISVTAVPASELRARNIVNVAGLAAFTPNMAITHPIGTKSAARIQIRGQVQNDALITLDPSVGVYVDDVYYARAYSQLTDLLDVSDVEVLKGPQGTFYGRNTTGGAVKVTTRLPSVTEGFTGYVKAGGGNFGASTVEGAVTIPLIKDMLAVRYAGAHRHHSGYTTTYVVDENRFPSTPAAFLAAFTGVRNSLVPIDKVDTDDLDTTSQRLTVVFEPTSNLRFTLQGASFLAKDHGLMSVNQYGDIANFNLPGFIAGGAAALPTPIDFFTTSPQRRADFYSALSFVRPFSSTINNSVYLTADYTINPNLETKAIVSYSNSKNDSQLNAAGVVTNTLALVQFAPLLEQVQHQFTAEWQVIGHALDNRLDFLGGLYYFREDGGEASPPNLGSTRTLGSSSSAVDFTGDAVNKSKSVYANIVYKWTDRLRTSAGVRYTEDDKQLIGFNRFETGVCVYSPGLGIITSTTPGGPCILNRDDKFSNTSWEVNVDYQFTPDIFAYAKANTGYRSGGEQLRAVNAATAQPFAPEKIINYEGGLKTEYFDNRARVNLAFFHDVYSNIQQSVIIAPPAAPTTTTQVVNAGRAHVNGMELDATGRVTDHLTLTGMAGVTDFEFVDPTIRQVLTPKWKWALSAIYDTPTQLGNLNTRVDYDYTGAQYAAQSKATPSRIEAYGLLNARAALTLASNKNIELAIWGKNLTDKKYYATGVVSADVFGSIVGAPRTFGGEVTYHF